MRPMLLICVLFAVNACSLLVQPPDFTAQDVAAHRADGAPLPPACLPARTGELVFNEILAKPAGVDLDGDGLSTGRDEALELLYTGDAPGHLQGAQLLVDEHVRGVIGDARCLQPGQLVVITGSRTADVALQPAAVQVRLSRPLELRDSGAALRVVGVLATDLGELTYPAALPGQSWIRQSEGIREAPLIGHPAVGGRMHSIGTSALGRPARPAAINPQQN